MLLLHNLFFFVAQFGGIIKPSIYRGHEHSQNLTLAYLYQ